MKRYQAVIFDLDGVIVSTDHYHYLAWKNIADEIGVRFDAQINNRLRGVSRAQSLEIILENHRSVLSDDEKKRYLDKKNALYRQFLKNLSKKDLAEDVRETLTAVKREGLRIAIGSSSRNTKLILKQIGLENFFDAVSDGTNIMHSKPDPEVFIKAGRFLGISPQYCLVVEDAKAGVEAAIAAGMDCVAIGDAVSYHIAQYELDKLSDLLSILGR